MPFYFLLANLTENGHRNLRAYPDAVVNSARECETADAKILTQYAVLGRYDFIMLVEAEDNDAAAQLSLEMSVRVGMHIETCPAIALSNPAYDDDLPEKEQLAYAEAGDGDWELDNQETD